MRGNASLSEWGEYDDELTNFGGIRGGSEAL